MRTQPIQTKTFIPTFKKNDSIVPYPELSYKKSQENVYESDPFENGFDSIFNKFKKAYRLLFSPEIDKASNDIKESIDFLVEGESKVKKGSKLSTVA